MSTPANDGMFAPCPVCDSPYTSYVRKVRTRRTKLDVDLFNCLACQSFWNPGEYVEDDDQLARDLQWGLGVIDRNHNASGRLFDHLKKMSIKPASVLEIGCGIGTLLQVAAERGMSAIGYDLNAQAIEAGRERYDVDLRIGNWDRSSECGDPDLILSISVLEHIAQPRPLFAEMCAAAAATGGALLVSVPMVDEDKWHHLLDPDPRAEGTWLFDNDVHVTHFSPQGLLGLFEEHGASKVLPVTEGLWQGYVGLFGR